MDSPFIDVLRTRIQMNRQFTVSLRLFINFLFLSSQMTDKSKHSFTRNSRQISVELSVDSLVLSRFVSRTTIVSLLSS